jgi:hypothetical protein
MPAQTPNGSLVVYTQAESRSRNDSPLSPPDATRLAKYSRTSAPVTMSTVEVSENGLPVSRVSILASSSFRERSSDTALCSIRARSIGGVLDQEGNAAFADATAESMSEGDEVWIVHVGFPVEGSIDLKVSFEDVEGCDFPA